MFNHSTVVANEGQRIDLPDGVVLENSEYFRSIKEVQANDLVIGLVSGNLNLIVSAALSSSSMLRHFCLRRNFKVLKERIYVCTYMDSG
jgi:hypothetical protein